MYSKTDQKRFVEIHDWEYDDAFWEQDVRTIYIELLMRVQAEGFLDGWYCGPREGFHRWTSLIMKIFRCKLDLGTGMLIPDSITENDFIQANCGNENSELSHEEFLEKLNESTFGRDHRVTPPETFGMNSHYFTSANLYAPEAAFHQRVVSFSTATNKRKSSDRCHFERIGHCMANEMANMTIHQASRRVDFSNFQNPTYNQSMKPAALRAHLDNNFNDPDEAFRMSHLYSTEEYQRYIDNPLAPENMQAVKNILQFPVMDEELHVPKGCGNEDEITQAGSPVTVGPPLLPSYKAMSIDVHKVDKESTFNPDTVNNAYFIPFVVGHLFLASHGQESEKAKSGKDMRLIIEYILRFCNNNNIAYNRVQLHEAWTEIAKQTGNTTICEKDTAIVGATLFILDAFNFSLSNNSEDVLHLRWAVRKAKLRMTANDFQSTFSFIGTTAEGRNGETVLSVLGECIIEYEYNTYRSLFSNL